MATIPGIPFSTPPAYCALEVQVTPELAKTWLVEHNDRNRRLVVERVTRYTERMVNDSWLRDGNTIAFDRNGRLINGQHRLHAVVESGKTVPILVAVNCDPLGFATTDTGRARNGIDILSIIDPDGTYHSLLSGLVRYLYNYEAGNVGQRFVAVPMETLVEQFETRGEALRAVAEQANHIFQSTSGSKLSIAAAYWIIAQTDPGHCPAFFEEWANGTSTTHGDPVWALARAWRNAPKRLDVTTRVAWILKAYNSWATGQRRTSLAWRKDESFPTVTKKLVAA